MGIRKLLNKFYPGNKRGQLRVLFSAPSYPHISNSYIHAEIVALQRMGVHVEVWSARSPTVPSRESTAPVHSDAFESAVKLSLPHIIYGNWLNRKENICVTAMKYGIPVVLRGHSYEFSCDIIRTLNEEPAIKAVYLFPHQIAEVGSISSKVRRLNVCYDNQQYRLYHNKDPKTVVRAAVARPEQGLELFIRVASRLPGFRFILIVCEGFQCQEYMKKLIKYNDDMGGPAEIRINQQYDQVRQVVENAAICMHTHSPEKNYGMPILVAEAMATGCYVLSPDKPGARDYIADAGVIYENEDQAVDQITGTLQWDAERWRGVREISSSRALRNFSADYVMVPVVAEWREMAGLQPAT